MKKDFKTLTKEYNQACKYFAKFVKQNNTDAALMWAEKMEELEKKLGI